MYEQLQTTVTLGKEWHVCNLFSLDETPLCHYLSNYQSQALMPLSVALKFWTLLQRNSAMHYSSVYRTVLRFQFIDLSEFQDTHLFE